MKKLVNRVKRIMKTRVMAWLMVMAMLAGMIPIYHWATENNTALASGPASIWPIAWPAHAPQELNQLAPWPSGIQWIDISTVQDLIAIGNSTTTLGRSYRLVNDIDISGRNWNAIGSFFDSGHFTGRLDGNGFTISGLRIDRYASNQGLFARIDGRNAAVKNLILELDSAGITGVGERKGTLAANIYNNALVENVHVRAPEGAIVAGTSNYIGGFVGVVHQATIRGCSVDGVTVRGDAGSEYQGGFAGAIYGRNRTRNNNDLGPAHPGDARQTLIEYCLVLDDASVTRGYTAGGFAGILYEGAMMYRCIAYANVTNRTPLVNYAGGLLAKAHNAAVIGSVSTATPFTRVEQCAAYGNVTGSGYVNGGLIGELLNAIVGNAYARGDVVGTTGVAGFIGYASALGVNNVISNTYSAGGVTSIASTELYRRDEVGSYLGLANTRLNGTNYYDRQTSGVPRAHGTSTLGTLNPPTGVLIGYDTVPMQYPPYDAAVRAAMDANNVFMGWDFDNIWRVGLDDGSVTYPYFLWANARGGWEYEPGISERPFIYRTEAGAAEIAGTGVPGATVDVYVVRNGSDEFKDNAIAIYMRVPVDANGEWSVPVGSGIVLQDGDVIWATQTEPGKYESLPATRTVGDMGPQTPITKNAENLTNPGGTYNIGDRVKFTVVINNTGYGPWNEAVMLDSLPVGLTVHADTVLLDGGTDGIESVVYNQAARELEVKIKDAIPGESSVTITYEATIEPEVYGKTIINKASIIVEGEKKGDDGEPIDVEGNLVVSKTASNLTPDPRTPGEYHPGHTVRYTVTVKLPDDAPAGAIWTDAVMTDAIHQWLEFDINNVSVQGARAPHGAPFFNLTTRVLTVPLGDIHENDLITITYTAVIAEDAVGVIKNIAVVGTEGEEEEEDDEDDEEIIITEPPDRVKPDDLELFKSSQNPANNPGGVNYEGDTLEYSITAGNNHAKGAVWYDVVLTDVLPAGVTFTEGSVKINNVLIPEGTAIDQYQYDSATRTLTVYLGDIATGAANRKVVTFEVTINEGTAGTSIDPNNAIAKGKDSESHGDDVDKGPVDDGGGGPVVPRPIVYHTVTFDINDRDIQEDVEVANGTTVSVPQVFADYSHTAQILTGDYTQRIRRGIKDWYFDRFAVDDPAMDTATGYDFSTPVTDSFTLFAGWERRYDIVYLPNGATSGTVPVDSALYRLGESTRAMSNDFGLARPNYVFTGWNINHPIMATAVTAQGFVNVNGNFDLYARWIVDPFATGGASTPISGASAIMPFGGNTLFSPAAPFSPAPITRNSQNLYRTINGSGDGATQYHVEIFRPYEVPGGVIVEVPVAGSKAVVDIIPDASHPFNQDPAIQERIANLPAMDDPNYYILAQGIFGYWSYEIPAGIVLQAGDIIRFSYYDVPLEVYYEWGLQEYTIYSYNVDFNSDGGSAVASQELFWNNRTKPASNTDEFKRPLFVYAVEPAEPTKAGFLFDGWYTALDQTGTLWNFGAPVTGNMTLFARWKADIRVTEEDLYLSKASSNLTAKEEGRVGVNYEGDTLEYVITARNQHDGTAVWYNVIITDTLPEGVTFVPGSVKINGAAISAGSGVNQYLYDEATHTLTINLGDIAPGTIPQKVIDFCVTIDEDMAGKNVGKNIVVAEGKDKDTGGNDIVAGPKDDNGNYPVTKRPENVTKDDIDVTKESYNPDADNQGGLNFEGDTLVYEITASNNHKGSAIWYNVILTDTLPEGVTFTAGSVMIDGIAISAGTGVGQYTYNSATHILIINLGDIGPGEQKFVEFEVTIDVGMAGKSVGANHVVAVGQDSDDEDIEDDDDDDGGGDVDDPGDDDKLTEDDVDVTKESHNPANNPGGVNYEGDTLVYEITASNNHTGDAIWYNVILTDTLPAGVTFKAGSVTLNGTAIGAGTGVGQYTYDSATRILVIKLGDIGPGEQKEVVFEVTINAGTAGTSIGANHVVAVGQDDDGEDIEDDDDDGGGGDVDVPKITDDDVDITKTSRNPANNPGGVNYEGDTLEYTITVKNTHDEATWYNVILTDALPPNVTFTQGSLKIGNTVITEGTGVGQYTYNSITRILIVNLGNISAGEQKLVVFEVTINEGTVGTSIGKNEVIANGKDADFGGDDVVAGPADDGGGGPVVKRPEKVTKDDVDVTKESYNPEAGNQDGLNFEGDTLVYEIKASNNHPGEAIWYNVILTDTLPAGVTFTAGSVKLNGTAIGAGAGVGQYTYDSAARTLVVNLGNIGPGEQKLVVFEVTIDEGMAGESIDANHVVAVGQDSDDDGEDIEDDDDDGGGGDVDDPGDDDKVTKDDVDVSKESYNPEADNQDGLNFEGDTLVYEIKASNNHPGDAIWYNVILTDTLPPGVTFTTGSVTINGATSSIGAGVGQYIYDSATHILVVNLGNIGPGEQKLVEFEVTIDEGMAGESIDANHVVAVGQDSDDDGEDIEDDDDDGGGGDVDDPGDDDDKVTEDDVFLSKVSRSKKPDNPEKVHYEGDTLEYIITVRNNHASAIWYNVVIKDELPLGVTFVPGSVKVNNVVNYGYEYDEVNRVLTVNLGNVLPGTQGQMVIEFEATIDEGGILPRTIGKNVVNAKGQDSEDGDDVDKGPADDDGGGTVVDKPGDDDKKVTEADVSIFKSSVNPAALAQGGLNFEGDTLRYSITVANNHTEGAIWYNVILTDTLPDKVTFTPGSVTLGGVAISEGNGVGQYRYINRVLTVNLGDIAPGPAKIVTFDVTIDEGAAGSSIDANHVVALGQDSDDDDGEDIEVEDDDGGGGYVDEPGDDDKVTKDDVYVSKTSFNPKAASQGGVNYEGDTLIYTIIAGNTHQTATWYNVILTDTLPAEGVTFTPGSVTIDGTPITIGTGVNQYQYGYDDDLERYTLVVNLGDIGPITQIILKFEVTIDEGTAGTSIDANHAVAVGQDSDDDDGEDIEEEDDDGGGGDVDEPGDDDDDKVTKDDVNLSKRSYNPANNPGGVNYEGDTLIYEMTASNNHEKATWYNVVITDVLPAGVTFRENSVRVDGDPHPYNYDSTTRTLTVVLGNIEGLDKKVLSFAVTIDEGTAGTDLDPNNAVAKGQDSDDDDGEDIDDDDDDGGGGKVEDKPAVNLSKISYNLGGANLEGGTLTYEIKASYTHHEASGTWYNVIITDTLPEGVTFKQGSVTLDGAAITEGTGIGQYQYDATERTLTVNLGNIVSGTEKLVIFEVTIDAGMAGKSIGENHVKAVGQDEDGEDIEDEDDDGGGGDVDTKTYQVTVNNSSHNSPGGGRYKEGDTVTVRAGTRANYIFLGWTVESGGVTLANISTATFTMPANDVTVSANWQYDPGPGNPDPQYRVTVVDSYASNTGGGTYWSGNTVTINAGTRTGYSFTGWTVTGSGVSFANANNTTTSFTMPGRNVTVTANWVENPIIDDPFTPLDPGPSYPGPSVPNPPGGGDTEIDLTGPPLDEGPRDNPQTSDTIFYAGYILLALVLTYFMLIRKKKKFTVAEDAAV